MKAFRSRKNGHKHLTFRRWLLSVLFASVIPSLVGVAFLLLGHAFGDLNGTEETVASIIGVSGILMFAGIIYAWIAVFIAAGIALLFLRFGWAGWAVPMIAGGLLSAVVLMGIGKLF